MIANAPQLMILAVLALAYGAFARWFAVGVEGDYSALNAYAGGSAVLVLFGYVILKRLSLDMKQLLPNSFGITIIERVLVPLLTIIAVIALNVVITNHTILPKMDVLASILAACLLLALADPGNHLSRTISDSPFLRVTGGGWKRILYTRYPPKSVHDLSGYFVVVGLGFLLLLILVFRKTL
jgi:hypothetical protein